MKRGIVIRAVSGFFTVLTPDGYYVCQLRGHLKSGPRLGDIAAIGDWVQILPGAEPKDSTAQDLDMAGTGTIIEVEPRQRMFSRLDPTPRGVYRQVIVANPDQMIFVFACTNPTPHLGMLDRFLVIVEEQEIPAIIIANKSDLLPPEDIRTIFGHYPQLGYPVIYTSAKTGAGLQELTERLTNKISVFAGPSGVGKSSLLNAIQPGLSVAVREISSTRGKGKHTTVSRQLYPLEKGGFIADTPGLKALALWDINAEEVDGYFPELRPLVSQCAYNNCTHLDEPDCAVRRAVKEGLVHPQRYRSYCNIRLGQKDEYAS